MAVRGPGPAGKYARNGESMAHRVLAGTPGPGNVILDLDGCLYVDDEAVPGARRALEVLMGAGLRLVFATNNSTKTATVVAERVEQIVGIPVDPAAVVTSAMAAASMLTDHDRPVLAIGERGLADTISAAGLALTDDPAAARAVVVGLDRGISYERLQRASHAVLLGARFIGTNPDATFPTRGVPDPGAGSIIAAVERAGGRAPEYAGKPHDPMRRCVEALLGSGPTWVVGDRAETDLAFGGTGGWTTVLVMTGVTRDASAADPQPNHVLDSVAGLASLILRD